MKLRTLPLTPEKSKELEHTRDHDPRAYLRERAAALLKIHAGASAYAVARHGLLKPRDPDTIYAWISRYERGGLDELVQKPRRKRKTPP